MTPKAQIKIVAYVVSGIYALVFLLLGIQLPSTAAKLTGAIPVVLVGLFALLDTVLWRSFPIKYLVRGRPRITGTWKGALTPADESGLEIPTFLDIRQTLTDISVKLVTKESQSRSVSVPGEPRFREFCLYYNYENIPGPAVRDRSPIHFGGVSMDVSGLEPNSLVGNYWTDRRTTGTFRVTKISTKHLGDFESASAASEDAK